MTDALTDLRRRIHDALHGAVPKAETWTDPEKKMAGIATRVNDDHGGAGIPAPTASILATVNSFRRSGIINSFRDLKYVCLGVGLVDQNGLSVLTDSRLINMVFGMAENEPEPRKRFRCFQALLSSYWTMRLQDESVLGFSPNSSWQTLRLWLDAEASRLLRLEDRKKYPWFAALERHADLLSPEPCARFGQALLTGDSSEFDDAIKSLAIPAGSWVFDESIAARIRAATALPDDDFKARLEQLLIFSSGTERLHFSKSLQRRCVARLVSRFAKCADRSENTALRTAALDTIGNPWIYRAHWDAWVIDNQGQPDNEAREMVYSWLKRRLISDFFTLLSVNETGDPRRLDYWLRFEPYISDMWFALGTDARRRNTPEFRDFRKTAKGRLLVLTDSTADNNAFVMHIGKYLAVEFGATGNAFFLFKWESLDEKLAKTLSPDPDTRGVSLNDLKAPVNCEVLQQCEARLTHMDSAERTWEQKFDEKLFPMLGVSPLDPKPSSIPPFEVPTKPPPNVPKPLPPADPARQQPTVKPTPPSTNEWTPIRWHEFVETHKLTILDNRPKKGSLWVLGESVSRDVKQQLTAWGFRCRPPRGWYKK